MREKNTATLDENGGSVCEVDPESRQRALETWMRDEESSKRAKASVRTGKSELSKMTGAEESG